MLFTIRKHFAVGRADLSLTFANRCGHNEEVEFKLKGRVPLYCWTVVSPPSPPLRAPRPWPDPLGRRTVAMGSEEGTGGRRRGTRERRDEAERWAGRDWFDRKADVTHNGVTVARVSRSFLDAKDIVLDKQVRPLSPPLPHLPSPGPTTTEE